MFIPVNKWFLQSGKYLGILNAPQLITYDNIYVDSQWNINAHILNSNKPICYFFSCMKILQFVWRSLNRNLVYILLSSSTFYMYLFSYIYVKNIGKNIVRFI